MSRRRAISAAMARFLSAWMVRASSIRSMPEVCHPYLPMPVMYGTPKTPLDRSASPKHPSGQRRFDCSSVVSNADRRPVRIAGSAAARHPAGGSTRRRSKVLLVGALLLLEIT